MTPFPPLFQHNAAVLAESTEELRVGGRQAGGGSNHRSEGVSMVDKTNKLASDSIAALARM